MPKVIFYVAATLDGFIARMDGRVDFLERYEKGDIDTGFNAFFSTIDTVVMGSKTYLQSLGFGFWAYGTTPVHVFTKKTLPTPNNTVHLNSGNPKELLATLPGKRVWLVGGSLLAASFLKEGLIDEIILTVAPLLIGNGIPLFNKTYSEEPFILDHMTSIADLVQTTYKVRKT